MNRLSVIALSLFVGAVQAADNATPSEAGVPQQPYAKGIESPGYVWNEMKGEELLALKAAADGARGADAYVVCQGCHGSDALGDATGYYPRLAGQHASVLIKQMVDVRDGRRDNPKEFPFVGEHVLSTQDIADIAVYLHGLPVVAQHGEGPGSSDFSHAASLYKKDCESCHGSAGQGDGGKFYPKDAGQHYAYLLRQAYDIRDGKRRNANPEMVDAIKGYSDADVVAVIDYISRFPVKVAQAKPDTK
jgi:cytochrome c553